MAHADSAIQGRLGGARPDNDNRAKSQERACELDCLVGFLAMDLLRHAAERAGQLGVGADRVLIAAGDIDERSYLQKLAHHCGMAIETFNGRSRDDVLLDDRQLGYVGRLGIIRLGDGEDAVLVVAPQMFGARRLVELTARYPALASRLRVATAGDLQDFLLHRIGNAIAEDVAYGLPERFPALSAAPRVITDPGRIDVGRIAASLALATAFALPPSFAVGFWSQLLALWFVAAVGLRFAAAVIPPRVMAASGRLSDAELPVYSVIVALYREDRSVPQLLNALDALDYPREKLDIILAVEADDVATRFAIRRFGAPHLRVIVAPDVGPRTKPKALNCALPFARGSVIAVFDAEDQPDPGQLRAAIEALRTGGSDVACAQASLCIHNVTDSLFTRMFAAEYAGQFDKVLPGLTEMALPLPLGGTSNHFRADALRA
ncbi:MAG: glycosyl transferase, family 2, partial [Tardiphaga sp.]|nr:glycosyl transferase, family 2 [Tardiphaga sp.]